MGSESEEGLSNRVELLRSSILRGEMISCGKTNQGPIIEGAPQSMCQESAEPWKH